MVATYSINIGIVAIGRNEGERLRTCLAAARRDCDLVIYVDSGSTDGSVALAQSLGVHVVNLDLTKPFTAARARNEGFAKLIEISSTIEAVQFIDGDCEIVAGWIEKAAVELAANAKARSFAVAGASGFQPRRFTTNSAMWNGTHPSASPKHAAVMH